MIKPSRKLPQIPANAILNSDPRSPGNDLSRSLPTNLREVIDRFKLFLGQLMLGEAEVSVNQVMVPLFGR